MRGGQAVGGGIYIEVFVRNCPHRVVVGSIVSEFIFLMPPMTALKECFQQVLAFEAQCLKGSTVTYVGIYKIGAKLRKQSTAVCGV